MRTGKFICSLLAGVLLCGISGVYTQETQIKAQGESKATYKLEHSKDMAFLKTSTQYYRALSASSPLKVNWALPMQNGIVKRISIPDEGSDLLSMLVETDNNDLIAIRRDNGEALWSLKLLKPIMGDICFGKFFILFVTDGRAVCLERISGDVLWNINLPFAPSAGPTAAEDGEDTLIVVIPGLDKAVYCFDVVKEAWPGKNSAAFGHKDNFSINIDYYRPRWTFSTESVVTSNPVYDDGMVFAGGWGNEIYGMSINSRAFNGQPNTYWKHRIRDGAVASAVVEGPNVMFPCLDHILYCFTTDEGALLWRYFATESLHFSPQLFNDKNLDKIYAMQKVGKSGPVVAIDPIGGKAIWRLENVDSVVAKIESNETKRELRSVAIFKGPNGKLTAVKVSAPDERTLEQKKADEEKQHPRSPSVLWSIDTPFANFVNNCYESNIYCTNADGSVLYALEEND